MALPANILGVRDTRPSTTDVVVRKTFKGVQKKSTTLKRKRSVEPLSPEEEERKRQQKEARELKKAEAKNKVIVGIDFGTTFSGIAYVSTTRTWKDVAVVTKWNGGQHDILEKVPTCIAYALENDFEEDQWGYGVKSGMTCTQWFKLGLDDTTPETIFDDPLLQRCTGSGLGHRPDGMSAQDVATDFFGMLYDHVLISLEEEIGKRAVEQTGLHFVISLPATWSLAARQATREAAMEAGFGTREKDEVVLIDEPEAAAIAAIKSTMAAYDTGPFQQNTCATIIDLGGGTVDLCTYRIIKPDPLQIEEACVGQGGKCGATTIDRNLHDLMQARFGMAFRDLPLPKIGARSTFMESFEAIKRDFRGDEDDGKVFELPLKMRKLDEGDPRVAASYDFEEDMVKITKPEMENMFEPVMKKTFDLFRKQMNRTTKAKMPAIRTIVLCGGLGSSPYIRTRFAKYIADELSGKMELVTPYRSWSAIARGAVIGSLGKSPVTFRRCKDHIGFCVHEKFEVGKHKESDKYECPIYGPRAKNQMRWHVSRGEKISANLKRSIDCYLVVEDTDVSKPVYVVGQDFFRCAKKKAPERRTPSVIRVGTMIIDLTSLVRSERARIKAEEGEYPSRLELNVTLEMTLGDDKGILEVTAKSGRKKMGIVQIEYDTNPAYKGVLISGDDEEEDE